MVAVSVPRRTPPHNAVATRSFDLVPRSTPFVMTGIAGMHAIYRMLYACYESPSIAAWLSIPTVSSDFCLASEEEKCGRPDLFAFQCISALAFWTCGSLSFYSWHISASARQEALMISPDRRIFTGMPVAEVIVAVNLAYQIWDFLVSLSIPEHCTLIMMTHHVVAAFVCYSVLSSHMLGYYAMFFLGMSEVSSMFLVLLDMSKYFEPSPNSLAHVIVEMIAGPLFVLTFCYYRVLLWWRVAYQFSCDIQHVVSSGQAEKLRPGRTWVLYLLLFLSVPMGLLQLYWLTLIAQQVQATVMGQEMA